MARRPLDPERAVEAVLRERAAVSRGRSFSVPLSELRRAAGLGLSGVPLLLRMVLKACECNGYRLVRVYARRSAKALRSNLSGVEVLPHSRNLLVFQKRAVRAARKAVAKPA